MDIYAALDLIRLARDHQQGNKTGPGRFSRVRASADEIKECLCACSGRTKGGRFLPGHDAKLKKALVADARAGKKRAVNKLEKLGWSKFLQEHSKSSTA